MATHRQPARPSLTGPVSCDVQKTDLFDAAVCAQGCGAWPAIPHSKRRVSTPSGKAVRAALLAVAVPLAPPGVHQPRLGTLGDHHVGAEVFELAVLRG